MAGRSTVYAPRGAAATSQPLATTAALHVLQSGGNAFDAAVVAAAVLNVVEPHMTGIGGDAFALFWDAEAGVLRGLDASGRAGSLLDADALAASGGRRIPGRSAAAVTVPGALAGWAALLEEYGTMTLAEALEPARRIAEEGFPVTPIIAGQWQNNAELLSRDPGARATYLIDGERAPEPGEWFRNPDLARSFEAIQREGIATFYGGSLGQTLVSGLGALGGFITLDDLRDHEVRWVEPISVDFQGWTVWELPPAGQGVAALEMLRILEPYDLAAMGHNSAEYLHHLIEAKKLAFEDLALYVADPDYMTTSVERILSDDFIAERRALLNPRSVTDRHDPDDAASASETIYLSVADQHGNMVSFINSVYDYFGSGIVIPGTGFVLQDRGSGFTLEEGHPNRAAPGKRPFHTIIPAFLTREGEPVLSFGLMGGAMQPQGHVQMLLNLLVFDMDLQEAVDAARFRHMSGRRVLVEAPIPSGVRQGLEAWGHQIEIGESGSFGGAQAVRRLSRGWAAASDPRKDGHAAGY